MAKILSHPFRLSPNGSLASVDQDSEQADREQIAMLALTVVGERPISPGYGITDPTAIGIVSSELAAKVTEFGPPVTIREVTSEPVGGDRQIVTVTFD